MIFKKGSSNSFLHALARNGYDIFRGAPKHMIESYYAGIFGVLRRWKYSLVNKE